ncbi:MAG TPA: exosortase K [Polyangiaceae bacterium]
MGRLAPRIIVLALSLLMMVGLKQHYSQATVDDLAWILAPTAKLVALASGSPFEFEAGAGYLSREHFFLIEKPCAGINFMIAALGMLVFVFSRKVSSFAAGARIVGVSVALSYFSAVLVNAIRILIALWLRSHEIASEWWTTARIHRVEGIAIYFGGLMLLHLLSQRLTKVAPAEAAT